MNFALTNRIRRCARIVRAASFALAFIVMATTLYLPMRDLAGALPPTAESESSERAGPSEQEERDGLDEVRTGAPSVAPLTAPPRRRIANKCDRVHRALSCSHLSISASADRARSGRPLVLRLRI